MFIIIIEWLSAKVLVSYQSNEVYSPVSNNNNNNNTKNNNNNVEKPMCVSDHLENEYQDWQQINIVENINEIQYQDNSFMPFNESKWKKDIKTQLQLQRQNMTKPWFRMKDCEYANYIAWTLFIFIGKYGSVSSRHCHLTVCCKSYIVSPPFRIDIVRMT